MAGNLHLPIVDLLSPDRISTVNSIRQACLDHGFFYVVNHGVDFEGVFQESRKFFLLPLYEKMKLARSKDHRGYTHLCSEKLDPSILFKGDLKEGFYIGPLKDNMNQWPAKDILPCWRGIMELYREEVLSVGKTLLSFIALALNLDNDFFYKVGALDEPMAFVRLLHYPGELPDSELAYYGASAHSDYGMITLLATDGVRGLQICKEKNKQPQVWVDVPHINGAFIVNIGDLLERWTNCLFRSTLHRVMATAQERFSVAFFLDPNPDCLVECLGTCCSDASPPKFPPIRSGDYLLERLRVTYASGG